MKHVIYVEDLEKETTIADYTKQLRCSRDVRMYAIRTPDDRWAIASLACKHRHRHSTSMSLPVFLWCAESGTTHAVSCMRHVNGLPDTCSVPEGVTDINVSSLDKVTKLRINSELYLRFVPDCGALKKTFEHPHTIRELVSL
ncbi:hypothetical protein J6590_027022 [Homalodisca vitripennis]|nr:hypothetical protein J6590_027022 [Homalodisca vitripennis]